MGTPAWNVTGLSPLEQSFFAKTVTLDGNAGIVTTVPAARVRLNCVVWTL